MADSWWSGWGKRGGWGSSAKYKPGDWQCEQCGAWVFASRNECFQCNRAKTTSTSGWSRGRTSVSQHDAEPTPAPWRRERVRSRDQGDAPGGIWNPEPACQDVTHEPTVAMRPEPSMRDAPTPGSSSSAPAVPSVQSREGKRPASPGPKTSASAGSQAKSSKSSASARWPTPVKDHTPTCREGKVLTLWREGITQAQEQKKKIDALNKEIDAMTDARIAISVERDEYRREVMSAISARRQNAVKFDMSNCWMTEEGMNQMFDEWRKCNEQNAAGQVGSTWGEIIAGVRENLNTVAMQPRPEGPLPPLIRKFVEVDKQFAKATRALEKKIRKGIRMARRCAIANMGNGIRLGWRSCRSRSTCRIS